MLTYSSFCLIIRPEEGKESGRKHNGETKLKKLVVFVYDLFGLERMWKRKKTGNLLFSITLLTHGKTESNFLEQINGSKVTNFLYIICHVILLQIQTGLNISRHFPLPFFQTKVHRKILSFFSLHSFLAFQNIVTVNFITFKIQIY